MRYSGSQEEIAIHEYNEARLHLLKCYILESAGSLEL
jgi:hypothetical protein